MGCDVKDDVTTLDLLGKFVLVIKIPFRKFDGQSGDVSAIAPRTNQRPNLLSIVEQRARQIAPDETSGASNCDSHWITP